MRVLWMKSDYVIPPDTGGKIRTYNLMRELNSLCDVTYLAFKPEDTPNTEPEIEGCADEIVTVYRPEEIKSGAAFYGRVVRGMASPLPYSVQKFSSPEIVNHEREFAQENSDPRVVLCDFLDMADNVDWSLPCPKVLFQHNVESMIWKRLSQAEDNPLKKAYFKFEYKRMAKYEAMICNRFDLIFAVSKEDKKQFQEEYGVTTPIEILETGVNTKFFQPTADPKPKPGRLVFLGSMDWMPNIDGMKWFVGEIYDLVKEKYPAISLDIVGRRPGEEIKNLARNDSSIQVLADVPDVRPHIAESDLFIVPLRVGGGSRIKIYEAMAMDRPVVSTTIGAEGLPLTPDEHIAIGDTPAEFADQIVRLLNDSEKKQNISNSGYRLVTENFQWKNVATQLRDHCQDLVKK